MDKTWTFEFKCPSLEDPRITCPMNQSSLKIAEAAKFLKVSTKTMRRWEKSGLLVAARSVGNQRLYSKSQLLSFKEKKSTIKKNYTQPSLVTELLIPDDTPKAKKIIHLVKRLRHDEKNLFFGSSVAVIGAIATIFTLRVVLLPSTNPTPKFARIPDSSVLAAETGNLSFNINVPTNFADTATFLSDLSVSGVSNLNGGVNTNNSDINAGTGKITASNVIYSLTPGVGIGITGGQNPTITNTGVLSLGGQTGAVALTAGSGISVSGTSISNSDGGSAQNIFKNITVGSNTITASSNNDTLTLTAGTGVTLTPDTSNKKITFTSDSGWTHAGTAVTLTTSSDSVGVGTSNPSSFKLQVAGNIGPDSTDLYNLGSSSLEFNNVYAKNVISSGNQSGFFQRQNGVISPVFITDDFVIGGSTTASARFQAYGDGILGGTNPGARIAIRSSSAGLIVDNSQGDVFTASVSGATKFVIDHSGNVGIGITPSFALDVNGVINATGYEVNDSGTEYPGATTSGCVITHLGLVTGSNPCPGSTSYFDIVKGAGAIYPGNNTNLVADLLIGGSATTSARFHAYGNLFAGTTPSASVSGNTSFATLVIDNKQGDLLTASSSGVTQFKITNGGLAVANTFGVFDANGNVVTGLRSATNACVNVTNGIVTGTGGCPQGASTFTLDATNGTIIPAITTTDLLLGGVSTSTAKFAVLNLAGGTPVASVGAVGSNTGIYISSDGSIQSTVDKTLTIGGNTTGDIVLKPGGNTAVTLTGAGNVGIGTTNPSSFLLQVNGSVGPNASASYDLGSLTKRFNNLYISGNLFSASGTQIGFWDSVNGILYPAEPSVDFLLGGTSTTSATFHAYGTLLAGTNPSASISGNTSYASFVIDNKGSGDLLTASSSGVTQFVVKNGGKVGIGTGNPTAFLDVNGNASISGTLTFRQGSATIQTTQNSPLSITSGGSLSLTSTQQLNLSGASGANNGITLTGYGTGVLHSTSGVLTSVPLNLAGGSNEITGTLALAKGGTNNTSFSNGSVVFYDGSKISENNQNLFFDPSALNLGIGTAAPLATLDVRDTSGTLASASISAKSSFATLIIDNTTGDLLTASSSGVTQFVVTNGGRVGIGLGTTRPSYPLDVSGTINATAFSVGATAGADSGGQFQCARVQNGIVTGIQDCGAGSGGEIWQNVNGAYSPFYASTVDLLLGGISTPTAKFAVLNINSGTPVASVSAQNGTSQALVLGSDESIQSVRNQTLTIGGGTTGNIALTPNNGSNGLVTINGSLNVTGLYYAGINNPGAVSGTGCSTSVNGIVTAAANCGQGSGGEIWQNVNGTYSPIYASTVDLLLGGISTATAKFAVLNIASGTPTASVSAQNANNQALVLGGDGSIQSVRNQTLTVGGNTTGNIIFIPNNGTNGRVAFSGYGTGLIHSDANGVLTSSALNLAGGSNEITGILPLANGSAFQTSYTNGSVIFFDGTRFNQNNSNLFFDSTNLRLGVGVGSPLTTLDVRDTSGTLASASISAKSSFATLIIDNTTGDLLTASSSGVTQFKVTNGGQLVANNFGLLSSNGSVTLGATSSIVGCVNVTNGLVTSQGVCVIPPPVISLDSANGVFIPSITTPDLLIGGLSTSSARFHAYGTTALNLNSTPGASVAANGSFAGFIVDNKTGDLFTASSSGVTQFVITNGGSVGIGIQGPPVAQLDVNGSIHLSSNSVINVGNSNVATTLSNVFCANVSGGIITGNGACPSANTSKWILDSANGVLYPTNITVDLLVGGSATNSSTSNFAKFAVLNVNSGTPTASVSAGVAGAAYLTGAGNLATTANQTLLLGGGTTGNIKFTPNGLFGNGNITLNGLGTFPTASISSNTSYSGLLVDNQGLGDIFDASASGISRFSIAQNGTVVIGSDQGTPTTTTLRGGKATASNTAGSDFYIDASNGTGNGGSGNIILRSGPAGSSGANPDVLAERFRITPNGLVGINQSNPAAILDVAGTVNSILNGTIPIAKFAGSTSFAGLVVDNASGDLFTASSSGLSRFVIRNNGNVGIGTTLPQDALDIAGNVGIGITATTSAPFKLTVGGNIGATGAAVLVASASARGKSLIDSSVDTNGAVSAAIGTDGLPDIAYYDNTGHHLNFIKCSTIDCSTANTKSTQIDNSPDDVGSFVSLAIGADGLPVMSYIDNTGTKRIRTTHCGNTSCSSGNVSTTLNTSTTAFNTNTSIAIGPDGLPEVAYNTNTTVQYIHCLTITCEQSAAPVQIDSSSSADGNGVAMTIATDGNPIIVYQTNNSTTWIAKARHCQNIDCSTLDSAFTLQSANEAIGSYPSVAIGSDGNPIVIEFDSGSINPNNYYVIHCVTFNCSSAGTAVSLGTTVAQVGISSIAIGPDGYPVISLDANVLKEIHCTSLDCSTFNGVITNTTTTVDGLSGSNSVGAYNSIMFSPDGNPFIAYTANNGGTYRLLATKCESLTCSSGPSNPFLTNGAMLGGFMANSRSYSVPYQTLNVLQIANPTTFKNLSFFSGGSERLTIGANGTIGINNNNPGAYGGALQIGNAGNAGSITLNATTSGSVTIGALASTSPYTLTLPGNSGTNGFILTTDGTGTTSWSLPPHVATGAATLNATSRKITSIDSSVDTNGMVSAAIGTDGFPDIAYYDNTGHHLNFIKCSTIDCSTANTKTGQIDSSSDDVGNNVSLAIGADGLPVMSHTDNTGTKRIRVTHCGNASCSSGNISTTLNTSTTAVNFPTSIAIGSDGLPDVVYNTNTTVQYVHCITMDCSGSATPVQIDSSSSSNASGVSMAIATDGNPVIIYETNNGTTYIAKAKHCQNLDCSGTIDGAYTLQSSGSHLIGYYPSVAIGSDGFPVMTYFDNSNNNYYVVHCLTTNCSSSASAVTIGTPVAQIGISSIAIGSDGFPVIALDNNVLKEVHCTSLDCSTFNGAINNASTTVDSTSGSIVIGEHNSIIISPDGTPIIAYTALSSTDKLVTAKCVNLTCSAGPNTILTSNGTILGGFTGNSRSYSIPYQAVSVNQVINPSTFANLQFTSAMGIKAVITPGGQFGFNTQIPLATLDLRGQLGTSIASFSSTMLNSLGLVIDSKTGDLLSASSSGNAQFIVHNGGLVDAKGGYSVNGTLGITTTNQNCLNITGGIATATCVLSSMFGAVNGAISSTSNTQDFLLGSATTKSAQFGVINLNSNSANTKNPQVFVSGDGSFQATISASLLTLVSSSSATATSSANSDQWAKKDFVISGKYAYLGQKGDTADSCSAVFATGCEVQIYDLSNPASPVFVNGIDFGNASTVSPGPQGAESLAISGKYLYVEAGDTGGNATKGLCDQYDSVGCEIKIYDISNPAYPFYINGIDNGISNAFTGMTISDNYLYVSDGGGTILAYDISNPSNPRKIGSNGAAGAAAYELYVQGKYLFEVTIGNSGNKGRCANACDAWIYDISDPSKITSVGSFDNTPAAGQDAVSIFVSGRYAYIGKKGNDGAGNNGCASAPPNDCNLRIYDISNINSPTYVGGIYTNAVVNDVEISGKYLYVAANGTSTNRCTTGTVSDGCEIKVYDISVPSNPAYLAGYDVAAQPTAVLPFGKYLYLAIINPGGGLGGIQTYDLPGIDTPTANFGEVTSGGLYITDNANINGYLTANSLGIGTGGILSNGALSAGCSSCSGTTLFNVQGIAGTASVASISGNTSYAALVVDQSGNGNIFTASASGNPIFSISKNGSIGIGTQNPSAILDVNGTAYLEQKVGINTNTPAEKLTIAGGNILATNSGLLTQITTLPTSAGTADQYASNNIYISGKYLYLGRGSGRTVANPGTCNTSDSSGCEIQIYDMTNPAYPAYVNGIDFSAVTQNSSNLQNAEWIGGFGKYLFAAAGDTLANDESNQTCSLSVSAGCNIKIYDISDPIHPQFINGIQTPTADNGGVATGGEVLVGPYLYISSTSGFYVYDLSSVYSPKLVADISGTLGQAPHAMTVQGKYLFVEINGNGNGAPTCANACSTWIFDISNPATPKQIATFDDTPVGQDGTAIAVSGRYLYIGKRAVDGGAPCTSAPPNDCNVRIYDISNTIGKPTYVGGIYTDTKRVNNLYISGKYLYVVRDNDLGTGTCSATVPNGCEIKVYDISVPSNPAYVTGFNTGSNVFDAVPYGKYLYVSASNFFSVYDLPGIDAPVANFGELTAGGLNVTENANVNGYLMANSLDIGTGGIYSNGTFAVGCSTCSAKTTANGGNFATPRSFLTIQGTAGATAAASITNTDNGSGTVGLTISLGFTGTGTKPTGGTPATGNRWIIFQATGSAVTGGLAYGAIESNGANGVTYDTGGADFAEWFVKNDVNAQYDAGTLMCQVSNGNGVAPCDSTNYQIVGVVSDAPGFSGGVAGPNKVEVGLLGQLGVKVSTENGVIKKGDPLTFSQTLSGVAVKATNVGQIVGRAQEDFDGSTADVNGVGIINALIHPSWYDPGVYLTNGGDVSSIADTKLISSTLSVNIDGTVSVSTESAKTQGTLTDLLKPLTDSINSLTGRVSTLEKLVQENQENATQSALVSQIATNSGAFSAINLSQEDATISGSLFVGGRTTLNDVGVTGTITAGVLSVDGLNGAIDTFSGPLKLQSQRLGGIDLENGLVTIDTLGNIQTQGSITTTELKTQKITIEGTNVATDSAVLSASAGTVTIKAGDVSALVQTNLLSPASIIFTTPDTPVAVGNKIQNNNSFTVSIKNPRGQDLHINWRIIN